MAKTERQEYCFTVKELGDGTPWVALEPRSSELSCLGDGFLGLDLMPGHSLVQAKEVARFLNNHIASVSHTSFGPEDR